MVTAAVANQVVTTNNKIIKLKLVDLFYVQKQIKLRRKVINY